MSDSERKEAADKASLDYLKKWMMGQVQQQSKIIPPQGGYGRHSPRKPPTAEAEITRATGVRR